METFPVVTTPRLLLRELTPADADFAYELNNDPEVLQYTGDEPFDSVEAARNFLENYSDYKRNSFGRWGVVLKETGTLIGWCGLKRDSETGEVDIGYRFFKKDWDKGYATEAASACLDKGFSVFRIDRIVGRARKDNAASIRVLEKLGMHFVEDFEEDGDRWVCYALVKPPVLQ